MKRNRQIAELIAAATAGRLDGRGVEVLAETALQHQEEDAALPVLQAAAQRLGSARLWQWTGLLARALERHDIAMTAYRHAARLAPADALVAYGRAQVALESGADAVDLFEQAVRLGIGNGEVLGGLAAARLAAGDGRRAEAELDDMLRRAPGWIDGHMRLGQVRALLGEPHRATETLERAIAAFPHDPVLWRALFDMLVRAERYDDLAEALFRARHAGISPDDWLDHAAIAAAERGETAAADRLFAARGSGTNSPLVVWHVRHLLRTGRLEAAAAIIDREIVGGNATAVWPYAALVWRLVGDTRHDWLVMRDGLVRTVDLGPTLPSLPALASTLRSLHRANGQYLDQSVRGGTQTDGPLFANASPVIRSARAAIVAAVAGYVDQLAPPDPRHPTLSLPRQRTPRFAGSWSVRLLGGGHHASHVHPQGWISSALYISLPETMQTEGSRAGWLTIGAPPPSLGLSLSPLHLIQPKEGRLVLFPSWMWHGTLPFDAGERLTIAFDVAPSIGP